VCDGVYAVVVLCSVEWCSEEVVAPTHCLCCVYVCVCVCMCVCVSRGAFGRVRVRSEGR
jgi:hypothetical protein